MVIIGLTESDNEKTSWVCWTCFAEGGHEHAELKQVTWSILQGITYRDSFLQSKKVLFRWHNQESSANVDLVPFNVKQGVTIELRKKTRV